MAERRYQTEFALELLASQIVVLQPHELEQISDELWAAIEPSHVYLVCRRPKVSLDPQSVVFGEQTVTGVFRIQRGGEFEEVEFEVANGVGADATLRCPYPHTHFEVEVDAEVVSSGSVAVLLQMSGARFAKYLDLEVLYVGQAYGFDGSRSAQDRLRSHSTLQGILAEALAHSPNEDVWLTLVAFQDPIRLSHIEGRAGSAFTASAEEDSEHIRLVHENPISDQQLVNLAEAILIRYFDAPYNTIYRKSFPNPAHRTYAECYDLDYNTVAVSLETESINARLFSQVVPPAWLHIAQFPLHDAAERRAMFELFE